LFEGSKIPLTVLTPEQAQKLNDPKYKAQMMKELERLLGG